MSQSLRCQAVARRSEKNCALFRLRSLAEGIATAFGFFRGFCPRQRGDRAGHRAVAGGGAAFSSSPGRASIQCNDRNKKAGTAGFGRMRSQGPRQHLGCTVLGGGRASFLVWAPRAETVELHLVEPEERRIRMRGGAA